MKAVKKLLRLFHINIVLSRNGFYQAFTTIPLFSPLKFIIYITPWNWRSKKLSAGAALRKTFEELGPIFIKFGQVLSTRPDILPPEIASELRQLQDNIPPFPSAQALAIIEKTFNESAYTIFANFDPKPLASASIAQVHAATLKTGEEVVVKILRPNLKEIIEQDLSILQTMANFIERYWSEGKKLKLREILQEFEYNLFNELDLEKEAANATQLRRNFLNSPTLYIPKIFWEYTSHNILVMERIYGIPVTDVINLKNAGINIKKLAALGVEIFFTQVFRDCFFHADMHPGNIFVSPLHQEEPQYICVDFGIIGILNDNDKHYLAENLHAFFNRNYRRVAQLHIDSGWVASDTRIDEFEGAIRAICEPIFEKPLKEISLGHLLLRFLQIARHFNMEVQPQLVLLQKTLLAVEGLGRQLYPDLDLWHTAKPFLEKWLKKQLGPQAFFRRLQDNLPFLIENLPKFPNLVHEVLTLSKTQKKLTILLETQKQINNSTAKPGNNFITGVLVSLLVGSLILFFIY